MISAGRSLAAGVSGAWSIICTGFPACFILRSGTAAEKTSYPSYEQVCTGKTGHIEVVEVIFDPKKTSYEAILRTFLEIHDPTQLNRQGPDVGLQYRSAIFYYNDEQRKTAETLLQLLRDKGFKIATETASGRAFLDGGRLSP